MLDEIMGNDESKSMDGCTLMWFVSEQILLEMFEVARDSLTPLFPTILRRSEVEGLNGS